jgi:hypothetical protein
VRQRRDRAKLDHRVLGDDAATVVAGHDHDHIAGTDTVRVHAGGVLVNRGAQLTEGERRDTIDDGNAVVREVRLVPVASGGPV